MATLRLTMAFDLPENNVMVSGLGLSEVITGLTLVYGMAPVFSRHFKE
jgi:hypothetical protein